MRAPRLTAVLALSLYACGDGGASGKDGATTDSGADATGDDSQDAADASADAVGDAADDVGDDATTTSATDASSATDTTSATDATGATDATTTDVDAGCVPSLCAALAEQRAAQELAALADDSGHPEALAAYLAAVPKGGDLHHHLSGAVYAETFLDWAADEGNYCIDTRTSSYLSLSTSCSAGTSQPIPDPGDPLYTDVVAEWSMEGFTPTANESGHDHFFATFGKFGAISGNHHGKMLADVMRRAASENQVYIELMLTSNSTAGNLGDDTWAGLHGGAAVTAADLDGFLTALLAASGLPNAVSRITSDVDASEAVARAELGCDGANPEPACDVVTRYQVYISRGGSLAGVFGQMVAAYEAGIVDARVVGLNLVGPEDSSGALSRYDVEMAMLGVMHAHYRATGVSPVRLSLHAGELAEAYLPSNVQLDNINHIQKAVETAHAERIGHGIDIMHEADPEGLMDELRDEGVLVEICLASNDQILEVSGPEHPLRDYLAAGVPVALGTDDQGVARSSMAREYRRAVLDQGLDYYQLKFMARTSLEYSFLSGESLWFSFDSAEPTPVCAPAGGGVLGVDAPSQACQAFLSANDRARVELELERRFRAFEAAR